STGPCKHIWAAVLAAEARGLLKEANAAKQLVSEFPSPQEGDDSDGLALDFGEEYFPQSRRPATRPASAPGPQLVSKPKPEPKEVWRKLIDEVSQPRVPASGSNLHFPAKRQILYVVDVEPSQSSGELVLALSSRDRKANGEWSRHSSLNLKSSQIS